MFYLLDTINLILRFMIKTKILISFFLGQDLATNWFVASLLQLTMWQLIKAYTCII
jgi:hypothetical protein